MSLWLEAIARISRGELIVDRRIATAYCVLVATTTIFALVAVVWFGSGSNLQGVPGIGDNFDSVWSLFAAPVILTLLGLFGSFSLTSTLFYARPEKLSPDAQRGLERVKNTDRRLLIGIGILVLFVQLLRILSTAGFSIPIEFGARTIFFVSGAILASGGNVIPKIPFFSGWWQIDRAIYTTVVRFSGWVLTIAGIAICVLAVFGKIENIQTSVAIIMGSGFGLVIIYALSKALMMAKKPA